METTVFLLRHGRTLANTQGRFSGRGREPLIEEGRTQARKAAVLLAGKAVEVIYASPMIRTLETAAILAETLQAPVVEEAGLAEINIPPWEGRLKSDLMAFPESGYPHWKKAPHLFSAPGAENLVILQRRAVEAIERIMARHARGRAAAVTHLAVMRCLLLHYGGKDLTEYRAIEVDNARPLALTRKNSHIYIDSL